MSDSTYEIKHLLAGDACVRQKPWSTLSDEIAWHQSGAKRKCQTTLIYDRLQSIKQLSIKFLLKLDFLWEKNEFKNVRMLFAFKRRRH